MNLDLKALLPPHQIIPSVAALFLLFFSRFGRNLKTEVEQGVGAGNFADRVTYMVQGYQLRSAVLTAFLLFFPSWMNIHDISAEFRGWVMVVALFLDFVFVVYPIMTTPIERITAPYQEANQSRWRRKLRSIWTGMSDSVLYRWCLGIPHFILIVANWALLVNAHGTPPPG